MPSTLLQNVVALGLDCRGGSFDGLNDLTVVLL